jgi:peptidoglycan/LPS O-acetylase OafA/YrhL
MEVLFTFGDLVFVSIAAKSSVSLLAPFVFGLMVYVFSFEHGVISRKLSGKVGHILGQLSYSIYTTALLISLVFNKGAVTAFAKIGRPIIGETNQNGQFYLVYNFGVPFANDAYALIYLTSVMGVS